MPCSMCAPGSLHVWALTTRQCDSGAKHSGETPLDHRHVFWLLRPTAYGLQPRPWCAAKVQIKNHVAAHADLREDYTVL